MVEARLQHVGAELKPGLKADISFWVAFSFTLGSMVWVVNGEFCSDGWASDSLRYGAGNVIAVNEVRHKLLNPQSCRVAGVVKERRRADMYRVHGVVPNHSTLSGDDGVLQGWCRYSFCRIEYIRNRIVSHGCGSVGSVRVSFHFRPSLSFRTSIVYPLPTSNEEPLYMYRAAADRHSGREMTFGTALGNLLHQRRHLPPNELKRLEQKFTSDSEGVPEKTSGPRMAMEKGKAAKGWIWWGKPMWHDLGYLAVCLLRYGWSKGELILMWIRLWYSCLLLQFFGYPQCRYFRLAYPKDVEQTLTKAVQVYLESYLALPTVKDR